MKSTLLLSVHPRFVEAIFAGTKRVELRRRLPRLAEHGRAVVYATSPTMALVGSFNVENVVRMPLGPLWRQVRAVAGITRAEYLDYFDGLTEGVGIFIGDVDRFCLPIGLSTLRSLWCDFDPPQGFRYLDDSAMRLLGSFSAGRKAAA